ncbi:MAG: hypothetical protein LPJ91_08860 [Pseudazoarcus pumilus]|nr:hypothetical protein [Pseudazoarcus pumilus]
MYENLFYGALGAAAGAVLKTALDVFVQGRRVAALKQALLEELLDLKERLRLVIYSYKRSLQIYALNGVSNDLPLKLTNPVYKRYYPEVALKFGASQRQSFSIIDSCVDGVNAGIDRVEAVLAGIVESRSEQDVEKWGDILKAQYKNAALAYWHVDFHLLNQEIPFLGEAGSEAHNSYLLMIKDVESDIEKLVQGARENLSREMFK